MSSINRETSDRIHCALEVLESAFSIKAPPSYLEDIENYKALVSTWNEYASLISTRDLTDSFSHHVVDSLSLLPYIDSKIQAGYIYIDVGSGGGFPALPILLFRRNYSAFLIERNQRKAAFLTKAVLSFDLSSTEVIQKSFPILRPLPPQPFALTARAIEKPDTFVKTLVPLLGTGSIFLRQAGLEPISVPLGLQLIAVTDEFDKMHLRRGRLYIVSRP